MANTSLISTVYSARLLEQFKTNLVFGNLINSSWAGDAVNNKTVKINSVLIPSSSTYTPESDITIGTLMAASQDLTIDQYEYFAVDVDTVIAGQSVVNNALLTEVIDKGSFILAKGVDSYIANTMFSGVAPTNLIPSASITASSDAYDYVVKLGQKLDEADVPEMGRFVVVSSAFKGLLQKDNRVTLATNALVSGQVPMVNGMKVFWSNNLPKTGNYTNIIAGVNEATAFAYGLKDLKVFEPEKRFSQAVKALLVYGAKVVNPNGIAVFPCIVN
jgi:hypothetical protein